MTFLIDGYNLMHAVGYMAATRPAVGGLDRARTRFLDWLAEEAAGRPDVLRVVFDAKTAPSASGEHARRGVWVRFAFRESADDVIEAIVAAEPRPGQLAVVSNDTRLQDAGRRRGCPVFTCEAFVDWLLGPDRTPPPPAPDAAEKPVPSATADEMAAWLAAFSAPAVRRKR